MENKLKFEFKETRYKKKNRKNLYEVRCYVVSDMNNTLRSLKFNNSIIGKVVLMLCF